MRITVTIGESYSLSLTRCRCFFSHVHVVREAELFAVSLVPPPDAVRFRVWFLAMLGRNSPIVKHFLKLGILVLLPVSTLPNLIIVKNYS
jgi:hypothetical protein